MIQTTWIGGVCPARIQDLLAIQRKAPPPKPIRIIRTKAEKRKARELTVDTTLLFEVVRENPGATTAQILSAYHQEGGRYTSRASLRGFLLQLEKEGRVKETLLRPKGETSHTKAYAVWNAV